MNNIVTAILVLGIMGGVFGLILAIASKVFEVQKDPREEEILALLAGANCGGCGYAGCADCAAHILDGSAPVSACAPAGPENAAAIAKVMGVTLREEAKHVAFVKCNGGVNASKRFEYRGVQDCVAAAKIADGPLDCAFGCLGFGSCVEACKFDAMHIGPNGTAVVDREKCTDCMACAAACPRHLIDSVPYASKVSVACANQQRGKDAMSVCAVSCIGCGLCEKNCSFDAIHVVNNVAIIDYAKCKGCKICTKVCPRDAISPIASKEDKEKFKELQKAKAQKKAAEAKQSATVPEK